jgi:hypothetical protein
MVQAGGAQPKQVSSRQARQQKDRASGATLREVALFACGIIESLNKWENSAMAAHENAKAALAAKEQELGLAPADEPVDEAEDLSEGQDAEEADPEAPADDAPLAPEDADDEGSENDSDSNPSDGDPTADSEEAEGDDPEVRVDTAPELPEDDGEEAPSEPSDDDEA